MWFEKMIRVVQQGLSDIEELEKMEAEEAARSLNAKKQPIYIVKL